MTSDTFPVYNGIAAADDLDALLTAGDFEPTVDVDTAALDAALDALRGTKALAKRLEALVAHLSAGGDADTATGLTIDVQTIAGRLASVLSEVVVDGTFETRPSEVLL